MSDGDENDKHRTQPGEEIPDAGGYQPCSLEKPEEKSSQELKEQDCGGVDQSEANVIAAREKERRNAEVLAAAGSNSPLASVLGDSARLTGALQAGEKNTGGGAGDCASKQLSQLLLVFNGNAAEALQKIQELTELALSNPAAAAFELTRLLAPPSSSPEAEGGSEAVQSPLQSLPPEKSSPELLSSLPPAGQLDFASPKQSSDEKKVSLARDWYDHAGGGSQTRYPDGSFRTITEDGRVISGRSQPFALASGEKGSLDIEDSSGRPSGLVFETGSRKGQHYAFSHDDKGQLSGITLPDGTELYRNENSKWLQSKDGSPSLEPVPGFNIQRNAAGEIKGSFKVNAGGDITYDNGEGVREVLRKEGGKQTYDYNKYCRTTEKDGKVSVDAWDGWGWRPPKKDGQGRDMVVTSPETGVTTIQFEPLGSRPDKVARQPAKEGAPGADSLTVSFADGSAIEARWKEQSAIETDAAGNKKTLYNDGHAHWRQGEKTVNEDGTYSVKFSNPAAEDLEKLANSKISAEVRTNPNTGEIAAKFANGSLVTTNSDGQPTRVRQPNGKEHIFQRDAEGAITKVTLPDGTVLAKRGEKLARQAKDITEEAGAAEDLSAGTGGTRQGEKVPMVPGKAALPDQPFHKASEGQEKTPQAVDKWAVLRNGKEAGTFEGSYSVSAEGTIDLLRSNGETTSIGNNGCAITRDANGAIKLLSESSGAQWDSADGKTFKLRGTAAEITGQPLPGPDGRIVFAGAGGEKSRRDADNSWLIADGKKIVKAFDSGARVEVDMQGNLQRTRDALGREKIFNYENGKLSSVSDGQGKLCDLPDEKGVLRQACGEEGKPGLPAAYAPDGTYMLSREDGARVSFRLDCSVITKTKDSKVTVANWQGETTYTIDPARGQPSIIAEADGSLWSRQAEKLNGRDVWKEEHSGRTRNHDVFLNAATGDRVERQAGGATVRQADGGVYQMDEAGNVIARSPAPRAVVRSDLSPGGSSSPAAGPEALPSQGLAGQALPFKPGAGSPAEVSEAGNTAQKQAGYDSWVALERKTLEAAAADADFAPRAEAANLSRVASPDVSRHTEKYPDGSQIIFDEGGKIRQTRDAFGLLREYEWEGGKLKTVKDPDGSVWERSDPEGKVWREKGSDRTREGRISVDPRDGTCTVSRDNKTSMSFNLDGSVLSRDANGKIDAVQDPAGRVRRFERDGAGDIVRVREADGVVWALSARAKNGGNADTWTKAGSGETWTGKVSLDDKTGTYKETGGVTGAQTIKYRDGWVQTFNKEGQAEYTRQGIDGSKVWRNARGQITDLEDAAQHYHKIEYSGDGKIAAVKGPGGTLLESEGPIEVRPDGSYRQKLSDSSEKIVNTDGSTLSRDSRQRPTAIIAASGKGHLFEYDSEGLKTYTEIDRQGKKTAWQRYGEGQWSRDGGKTVSTFSVRVLPGGTVEETMPKSGLRIAYGRQGSELSVNAQGAVCRLETEAGAVTRYQLDEKGNARLDKNGEPMPEKVWKTDGSQVAYNEQGRVSSVRDALGVTREFKYDDKGNVIWHKDASGSYYTGDDPSVKPGTPRMWFKEGGGTWTGHVEVDQKSGTFIYYDSSQRSLNEVNSDGTRRVTTSYRSIEGNGTYSRTTDRLGRVTEVVRGNGETYGLGYKGDSKELTSLKMPGDQGTWEKKGDCFVNSRTGASVSDIQVEAGGNIRLLSGEGTLIKKTNGKEVQVSSAMVDDAVKRLEQQYKKDWWSSDGDVLAILKEHEGNPDQIKAIETEYERRTGDSLRGTIEARFANNSNKPSALALLDKEYAVDNRASSLRTDLSALSDWTGRTSADIQKNIRDTIRLMSRDEIRQTTEQYRNQTGGRDLYRDLIKNGKISEETKQAIRCYWPGADHRNENDLLTVAGKAIEARNLPLFQEIMSEARPETRQRFLDNGGQERLEKKFGGSWLAPARWVADGCLPFGIGGFVADQVGITSSSWSNSYFKDAMDHAHHGKLSAERAVEKNTSWLGDNEKAIENALSSMTPAERKSYANGDRISRVQRDLAGGDNGSGAVAPESLSAQEQADYAYYKGLHDRLYAAAGSWLSSDSVAAEMNRWEFMAMNEGGSQFVKDLSDHVGTVYNSGKQGVLQTVENMSQADWDYLKNHPESHAQVKAVMARFGEETRLAAVAVFEGKMSAATYEESRQQKRSIDTIIKDNIGTFTNDRAQIYDAIAHMSTAERALYAEGKRDGSGEPSHSFALRVDKAVDDAFGFFAPASAREVAQGMLRNIADGKEPLGVVETVNKYAADQTLNKMALVRELQQRFHDNPQLFARLKDVNSEERRAFDEAINKAFRFDSFKKRDLIDPMMESASGAPPLAAQIQYDAGLHTGRMDRPGILRDIEAAAADQRAAFLAAEQAQNRALRYMTSTQREFVLKLASMDGKMQAEDHLRAFVVGLEKKEDARAVLGALKDAEKHAVQDSYLRKYGSSLDRDLEGQMSKADYRESRERLAPDALTDQDMWERRREMASGSATGLGADLIQGTGWDGTVDQAWDAVDRYTRAVRDAHAEGRQLSREEQDRYQKQVGDAIETLIKSKADIGDRLVDLAVMGVAIGGAVFTGGGSLSLMAATTAFGAVFKVAANRAIQGGDYDGSLKNVLADAMSGGLNGLLNFIGPAELGKMFSMGEAAAARAAGAAMKDAVVAMEKAGIKGGIGMTEAQLCRELAVLARQGIASGAREIDQKAIAALAARAVSNPAARDMFAGILSESFKQAVGLEARSAMSAYATAYGLSAASGFVAGATSGGVSEVVRADFKRESPGEVMERAGRASLVGGLAGAPMAVGFHAAFQGLGYAYQSGRNFFPASERPAGLPGQVPREGQSIPRNAESAPGKGESIPRSSESAARPAPAREQGGSAHGDATVTMTMTDINLSRAGAATGNATGARLTVEGRTVEVNKPISIGRDSPGSQAQIRLDASNNVSRNHAEVKFDEHGNRYIRDSGSAQGTWIMDAQGHNRRVGQDFVQVAAGERVFLADRELKMACEPAYKVELGGRALDLAVGSEKVFGRADFPSGNGYVSGNHGRIGMDVQGLYVIDGVLQPDGSLKPSTNGIFVNGERLKPGERVHLKESDRVQVGGDPAKGGSFEEIHIKPVTATPGQDAAPQAVVKLMVGQRALELKAGGAEQEIGRGDFGAQVSYVSARHGRLGLDEKGIYIVDGVLQPDGSLRASTNGTFVNGQRLKPGEKVYLKPADDVYLGGDGSVMGRGEKLHIFTPEKFDPRPGDPVVFQQAMDQANHFGQYQELRGKIRDGFEDAGKFNRYDSAGNLVDAAGAPVAARRHIIVVDRANDPVLRETIAEAHRRFDHLPPKERAGALTRYVHDMLNPQSMSQQALDEWHSAFAGSHRGEKIPLGRFIQEGKGVCIEQATLLKVLGDELGLDVTLVRGAADPLSPDSLNHAWTHMNLPGSRKPLIYDPRWGREGEPYGKSLPHRRGSEVVAAKAGSPAPEEPHASKSEAASPAGSRSRIRGGRAGPDE